VPKGRFVSYTGASTDNDPSILLGWVGWNRRDQAEVLVNLLMERSSVDGWSKGDPRFVPLLAGLQEITPWVHQRYDAYDEEWGDNPAQKFQTALNRGAVDRNLSQDDLRSWRPGKASLGSRVSFGGVAERFFGAYEGALDRDRDDEALIAQLADGPADGVDGYAVLLAKVTFGRQPCPCRQAAAADLLGDVVHDLEIHVHVTRRVGLPVEVVSHICTLRRLVAAHHVRQRPNAS
jgi:hypothetical protein